VLERLDGGPGAVTERAAGIDGPVATEYGCQTPLDVGDGLAGVAYGDRQPYR
jgi:hypothetical protein